MGENEKLKAENEKLKAEYEKLKAALHKGFKLRDKLRGKLIDELRDKSAEIEKLKAENEKLKAGTKNCDNDEPTVENSGCRSPYLAKVHRDAWKAAQYSPMLSKAMRDCPDLRHPSNVTRMIIRGTVDWKLA